MFDLKYLLTVPAILIGLLWVYLLIGKPPKVLSVKLALSSVLGYMLLLVMMSK